MHWHVAGVASQEGDMVALLQSRLDQMAFVEFHQDGMGQVSGINVRKWGEDPRTLPEEMVADFNAFINDGRMTETDWLNENMGKLGL